MADLQIRGGIKPRSKPPTRANEHGHQTFRVWAEAPVYVEDGDRWKCVATFAYLLEALDYIASCQDQGATVVFQSPCGCTSYGPNDRRAVAK